MITRSDFSNMAEDLLPELSQFVLLNVKPTGNKIGSGTYSSVERVEIPVEAAAKKIHDHIGDPESKQFAKECRMMSTLQHPHIVRFLGLSIFNNSRLPALVMEHMLTSLHDLLAPDTQHQPGAPRPLSFFTVDLKVSVLYDVAKGLKYLHEQSPPIIHRNLSAKNLLLNSKMVAKISDLGVARVMHASAMTLAPGNICYMPPEAMESLPSDNQKSAYDSSIDIFSFGVGTIFTIGEKFPSHPLKHNYTDEKSGSLVPRTELERRQSYMECVYDKLKSCEEQGSPIIRLIEKCLQNQPVNRPTGNEVLRLLEEAKSSIRASDSETNKIKLVQALEAQNGNKVSNNFICDA